ncbi:MAG TPA: hypothetical protein VHR86_00025 [Armatimonadota bacterium]|nr:hypothetical protein [Armatimonadota bacterium]
MDFTSFRSKMAALMAVGSLILAAVVVGGCAIPDSDERASNFGTVEITVRDQQGNPISDARAVIESSSNFFGTTQTFRANNSGQIIIKGLSVKTPASVLNLLIAAPGFVNAPLTVVVDRELVTATVTLLRNGINATVNNVPVVSRAVIPAGLSEVLRVQALVNGLVSDLTSAEATVVSGSDVISVTPVAGERGAFTVTGLRPGIAAVRITVTTVTGQTFTTTIPVEVTEANAAVVRFTVNGNTTSGPLVINTLSATQTLGVTASINGEPATISTAQFTVVSGQNVVRLTPAGTNKVTLTPLTFGTAVVQATVTLVGGQRQTVALVVNVVHPQAHIQGGGVGG